MGEGIKTIGSEVVGRVASLRLTGLVLAGGWLLGGMASLAFASDYELIKVQVNEQKSFSWPYYLVIPSSVSQQTTLLVEPNNTGSGGDDPQIHDEAARRAAEAWSSFATELRVPLLVPTFPRPYTRWQIYTQALDRDTLLTRVKGLERIDLQLIAMIDDARERLSTRGIFTEKKVFMKGFSASGHSVVTYHFKTGHGLSNQNQPIVRETRLKM